MASVLNSMIVNSNQINLWQNLGVHLSNSRLIKAISCIVTLTLFCAIAIKEWRRRSNHFKPIPSKPQNLSESPLENSPLVNATAYRIEDVLARLKEGQKQGLKLALFVGRTHTQILPQEKGWLWCSLDIEKMEGPLPADRLHLCMDINKFYQTYKIKELFDKVISDASVIKFIDYPWSTLKELLVNKPEATLLAETWTGFTNISANDSFVIYKPEQGTMTTPSCDINKFYEDENEAFKKWKIEIGDQEADTQYQQFLSEMSKQETSQNSEVLQREFMRYILQKNHLSPKKPDYLPELLKSIETYLLKHFEKVELIKNQDFPYRTGEEATKQDYWIASSPIKSKFTHLEALKKFQL